MEAGAGIPRRWKLALKRVKMAEATRSACPPADASHPHLEMFVPVTWPYLVNVATFTHSFMAPLN